MITHSTAYPTHSCSSVWARMTEAVLRLDLDQGCTSENLKGLLQASDLCLAACLLLCIRHHLLLTLGLELVEILEHSIQLLRNHTVVFPVVLKRHFQRLDLGNGPLNLGFLGSLGGLVLVHQFLICLDCLSLTGLGLLMQFH